MGRLDVHGPFSDREIAEGDVLIIRAEKATPSQFRRQMRLKPLGRARLSDDTFIDDHHTLLGVHDSP